MTLFTGKYWTLINIAVGNDLLTSFYDQMNKGQLDFDQLAVMMVFCLCLLMMVEKVPPLVAGVITAANIGSGGAGHSVGAMAATQVAAGVAYDVGKVGAKKRC